MKSMPGSDLAVPLLGAVTFVPSIRNMFSLAAEPKTGASLVEVLTGEVGDAAGAVLIRSAGFAGRVGIVGGYAGPRRVSAALPRASMREPAPLATVDCARPPGVITTVR